MEMDRLPLEMDTSLLSTDTTMDTTMETTTMESAALARTTVEELELMKLKISMVSTDDLIIYLLIIVYICIYYQSLNIYICYYCNLNSENNLITIKWSL